MTAHFSGPLGYKLHYSYTVVSSASHANRSGRRGLAEAQAAHERAWAERSNVAGAPELRNGGGLHSLREPAGPAIRQDAEGANGSNGGRTEGNGKAGRSHSPSSLSERLAVLGNTPVLTALPEDVQVRLAGFAQEKVFRKGQTVFSKGDPGSNMMIVAEGWVCMRGLSSEGAQITFAIAKPGDVFGEMSMLDGECREADAVAGSQVRLLVVERRHLVPALTGSPHAAIHLMSLLSRRARAAQVLAEDIAFAQAPARLAKALLHLCEPIGAGRARVHLKLSQRDLASMAATSRETINRLLRRWQDDGLIVVGDDGITLSNMQLLRALAA